MMPPQPHHTKTPPTAALFEFADPANMLSSFDLPELYSDNSDGSPEAVASGQLDIDVYDYVQFEDGQLQDETSFSFERKQEKPAPPIPMKKLNAGERKSGALQMYGEVKRKNMMTVFRIGIKTKSDVDILDDGYKWRMYGKKAVKNSTNPRCTSSGCRVKKTVERDFSDHRYVITTYEGMHNHECSDRAALPLAPSELVASSSTCPLCGEICPRSSTPAFTYSLQFPPPSS